ncbi:glycine cleavage system aminomethyltransferase GcvT [Rhodoligotrophos defluvii]|uniref:glycine cleavage system aminomethyltransferase GcvT n=1 Tax=Rhodoligotrophos defluvii TaxID=2561934 RepID=UPI0010C9F1A0|nr:glycine cleavage system aminomethyltransferase GcvT [Rhodoligotrophos defluvii]
MAQIEPSAQLLQTPLFALHQRLGGRMVPFAGYALPVQYPTGIIAEHLWTRAHAGLFDVSHMGQAWLTAPFEVAEAFERLVPGDIASLDEGHIRYTQLTTDDGGIIDDLMVTRAAAHNGLERLFLVVNASRKAVDFVHIATALDGIVRLTPIEDRALLALQGPEAAAVLAPYINDIDMLSFMTALDARFTGHDGIEGDVLVSRSGYTGEDGFELSVPAAIATAFAESLLRDARVKPAGLGARDSLRLEAGLCLYGQDIDETTSPVEAGLVWSIGKRRRERGGFPGFARIARELANKPSRRLVGLKLDGRAPARHGAAVETPDGTRIGEVTSGGFSPSLGLPIALAYVAFAYAQPGTALTIIVRDKPLAAEVVRLPFVPHRYVRR